MYKHYDVSQLNDQILFAHCHNVSAVDILFLSQFFAFWERFLSQAKIL